MPKTLERPISASSDKDKGRPHILNDGENHETYLTLREVRLQGAASAAGVLRPSSARAVRERAFRDTQDIVDEPDKYHIPHPEDSESQQ